jgi:hypothetical protein
MSYPAVSQHPFRRIGTAQRALTRAPLVPSQDCTRYQAVHIPPPTYDLSAPQDSWRSTLIPALALVATGAVIVLIQSL